MTLIKGPEALHDAPAAFYRAFSREYAVAQKLQEDFLQHQHELKTLWQHEVDEAMQTPQLPPLAIGRPTYQKNYERVLSDDYTIARKNTLSILLPKREPVGTETPTRGDENNHNGLDEYQVIAFGPLRQRVAKETNNHSSGSWCCGRSAREPYSRIIYV